MKRRSPLAHKFPASKRVTDEVNNLLTGEESTATESGKRLVLCDLTTSNRAGFRGGNIASWLEQELDIVAPPINQARKTQQGFLVIRLSRTEILIQEDINNQQGDFAQLLEKTGTELILKNHSDVYYLPRRDSHACFMVCGEYSAQLFSKLCAVDLRYHKFSDMSVAQTVVARVNAIIVRRDLTDTPGYFVLTDSSLAEYLWDCLADAMQEFQGRVIG